MNIAEAVFYGIFQGITEFLPISSSGHLAVLGFFLSSGENNIPFFVVLHVGTFFSIMAYFRRDIVQIIVDTERWILSGGSDTSSRQGAGMLMYILAATFLTGIIAFPVKDFIENSFSSMRIISWNFIVTGILLGLAYLKTGKDLSTPLNLWRSAVIGIVQGIAALPGISRSGSTVSAGILLNIDREKAAKFSFLIGIPAIAGATLLEAGEILNAGSIHIVSYGAGLLTAFLSGMLSIHILFKAVMLGRLHYFSIYCLSIGILLFFFMAVR